MPGNHDEFARRYVQHNFGGVDVVDDWIHETADGRKLWVVHTSFDGVIQCARWLAHVGDFGLRADTAAEPAPELAAGAAGAALLSLSRYLKLKVSVPSAM